ncbi:MAG: cytochrome c biogenesis protein ResB [Candidatus Krumholzibacteriota bacterium]|nr:cytochrome c biogenesis protein ResB [Candidatus Krumholzibacteriota bacterium]
MESKAENRWSGLISHQLAVTVIIILFIASAAGWIMSEVIPGDFPLRREMYQLRWGKTLTMLISKLKLFDPFHSFWYQGVLTLFFLVLLLCLLTRGKGVILKTFRLSPPGREKDLRKRKPRVEFSWHDLRHEKDRREDLVAHYAKKYGPPVKIDEAQMQKTWRIVEKQLRKRRYKVTALSGAGEIVFSALVGRWRYLGNFLFHAALLVITVGGLIGSFWGNSEMLFGKAGDILPLLQSPFSILVEDFKIHASRKEAILDYISRLSVLDDQGDTVKTVNIEVNHPLKWAGYSILQSSYYVDDKEFSWARLVFTTKDKPVPGRLTIEPGREYPLPGTDLTLRAGRFFSDFKMRSGKPYSTGAGMTNPALEILLDGPGGGEQGWLFLLHPRFNSVFKAVERIGIEELEPVYYTGLQINSNPGAPVFITGMIIGTIGLLLLYVVPYRHIQGRLDREGLVMAAAAGGSRGFHEELYRLQERVKKGCADMWEEFKE